MGDLDIAAKALLREEPGAFVRLALPRLRIRSIEPDETELHAIERRMDKLLRVEIVGEAEPVSLHVEVEAVWASDVPRRVHGYWALAHQTKPTVRSLVLVLRPGERQGDPVGAYEISVLGDRVLSFSFDVICAWRFDARDLLSREEPGLLPLVPFARGATPGHVEDAFRLLGATGQRHIDMQVVLAVFSEQVFPARRWLDRIDEEMRMQNPVYSEIEAHGVRRTVAQLLRARLGKSKRTEAIIALLPLCGSPTLDKIGVLLVGRKKKPELYAAIERLLPKVPDAE